MSRSAKKRDKTTSGADDAWRQNEPFERSEKQGPTILPDVPAHDPIDECSDESFPASDPPSSTRSTATRR